MGICGSASLAYRLGGARLGFLALCLAVAAVAPGCGGTSPPVPTATATSAPAVTPVAGAAVSAVTTPAPTQATPVTPTFRPPAPAASPSPTATRRPAPPPPARTPTATPSPISVTPPPAATAQAVPEVVASGSDGDTGKLRFSDVTLFVGITHTHTPPQPVMEKSEPPLTAGGAVAEDFDNDGWVDLFVLRGGEAPSLLYMNMGDGTFRDEAVARGADLQTVVGGAAAAADYDNDGDVDIVVANHAAPHSLLINDGTGRFTVDESMLTEPRLYATSPSWGDVDNDGLLELVLGSWVPGAEQSVYDQGAKGETAETHRLWVYRNVGAGRLETYQFNPAPINDPWVLAPRFADLNGDRLSDLAVVSDFGTSQVYLNVGGGMFQNVTETHRTGSEQNGMGNAIGDYDNDGDLDWFISSIFDSSGTVEGEWDVTGNRLFNNGGDGSLMDVTEFSGVRDGDWGWAASFGDLDNDGDLDLFHVNGWVTPVNKFMGVPARLFENINDGTFVEVAGAAGADDKGQGRGVILFDYDNDGDLDIFITNNEEAQVDGKMLVRGPAFPALLRNDTVNGNHWLKVTLQGEPPLHRSGIGSRVYVTAGGRTQMRELHASTNYVTQEPGTVVHFGLGKATRIDQVRAEWVSGDATVLTDVSVDQQLVLPSPKATIGSRIVAVGQEVTASAGDRGPAEVAPRWSVEGESHSDPLSISFDTPGIKELVLELYSAGTDVLLRTEVLRVMVVDPDSTGR